MSRLLHISASPRGSRSESLAIARTFLQSLGAEPPEIDAETWDLWDGSLPAFGPDAAAGKYAVFAGADHTPDQAAAWAGVRVAGDRFTAAEYYLFPVQMWNHGVPYVLKAYIDVVSNNGM